MKAESNRLCLRGMNWQRAKASPRESGSGYAVSLQRGQGCSEQTAKRSATCNSQPPQRTVGYCRGMKKAFDHLCALSGEDNRVANVRRKERVSILLLQGKQIKVHTKSFRTSATLGVAFRRKSTVGLMPTIHDHSFQHRDKPTMETVALNISTLYSSPEKKKTLELNLCVFFIVPSVQRAAH